MILAINEGDVVGGHVADHLCSYFHNYILETLCHQWQVAAARVTYATSGTEDWISADARLYNPLI